MTEARIGQYYIDVKGLKIGGKVETIGVFMGYKLKLLMWEQDHMVIAIGSYSEWMSRHLSQSKARVIIVRKVGEQNDGGRWICETVWRENTGKQWRKVRKKAIEVARRMDREMKS